MSSQQPPSTEYLMPGGMHSGIKVQVDRFECLMERQELVRRPQKYNATVVRHSRTGMVYMTDERGEPRIAPDDEVFPV